MSTGLMLVASPEQEPPMVTCELKTKLEEIQALVQALHNAVYGEYGSQHMLNKACEGLDQAVQIVHNVLDDMD